MGPYNATIENIDLSAPPADNLGSPVSKIGKIASGLTKLGSLTPSGGAAQLALGGIQRIAGAIKQKKANAMFPEGEDPELRSLATSFSRRKRAFQTGTALESQKAQIRSMGRAGINAAFRAGGGTAGLNKMAQLIQQGMTGLQDEALKGELAYSDRESDIVKQLAQTKLEKQMLRYNQAQAEAKQLTTQANRNMGAGFNRVIGIPEPKVASGSFAQTQQEPQQGVE